MLNNRRSIQIKIIRLDECVSIGHLRILALKHETVSERTDADTECFGPPCCLNDLSGSFTWWLVRSRAHPWQVRPSLVTLCASAFLIQNRFRTCRTNTWLKLTSLLNKDACVVVCKCRLTTINRTQISTRISRPFLLNIYTWTLVTTNREGLAQ